MLTPVRNKKMILIRKHLFLLHNTQYSLSFLILSLRNKKISVFILLFWQLKYGSPVSIVNKKVKTMRRWFFRTNLYFKNNHLEKHQLDKLSLKCIISWTFYCNCMFSRTHHFWQVLNNTIIIVYVWMIWKLFFL